MQEITSIALVLVCVYLLIAVFLYLYQRKLIYFPVPVDPGFIADEVTVENDGIRLHGWVLNPDQPRALIYFGGNSELITHRRGFFEDVFGDHSVYLINYRGYGHSEGRPSEAALFSLRQQDRRFLKAGTRAQRLAADLLDDPDRLLSAVLFWNLVVNMTYFAVASIAGFRLETNAGVGQAGTVAFAGGSVLAIIFFSEMLPKTLAVIAARTLSALFAMPLAGAVRAVDPLMPALRLTNLLSRRPPQSSRS